MRRSRAPSVVRRRTTPPLAFGGGGSTGCAHSVQPALAAVPRAAAALRPVQHNVPMVRRVGTPPQRPSTARRSTRTQHSEEPGAALTSKLAAVGAGDVSSVFEELGSSGAPRSHTAAPPPGAEAAMDEEDLLELERPARGFAHRAVTSEWLSSSAGACTHAVAGAERLLGVWRAVGTMPESSIRVEERFVLRRQGDCI
eukprot:COSAG03_NODE_11149_length_609_cov_0.943137_1_plen_197_part_01